VGRLVRREPLPPDSSHDPAEHTSRRLHATSADGTQVGLWTIMTSQRHIKLSAHQTICTA
jgi:hypothetical protein